MSQHQTVAAGVIPAFKYPELGGFTGRIIQPPERITALIFGLAGVGKSALMQSCPDAFIFNLDKTSTVTDTVKARIWPNMDPKTGETLDDQGKPAPLTYEAIREKISILKQLAKSNAPRPAIIVFDSLSAWLQLLKEYIPRNAVPLALRKAEDGPVEHWRQLQGQSAYDTMADMVAQTIVELQSCGYGVYIIAHIVNKRIQVTETTSTVDVELTCYSSVWKRVLHLLELSLCMTCQEEIETRTFEQVFPGKTQPVKTTRNVKVTKYALCYDRGMPGLVKKRIPNLPERIVLPSIPDKADPNIQHASDGWAAFAAAYHQAASE